MLTSRKELRTSPPRRTASSYQEAIGEERREVMQRHSQHHRNFPLRVWAGQWIRVLLRREESQRLAQQGSFEIPAVICI